MLFINDVITKDLQSLYIKTIKIVFFGGYSSVSWTSLGDYNHKAPGCFIFKLSNNKNVPPTKFNKNSNDTNYIYNHSNNSPCFGGGIDLGTYSNFGDNRWA